MNSPGAETSETVESRGPPSPAVTEPGPAVPPVPSTPSAGGFWEWVFRRNALRQARAADEALLHPAWTARLLEHVELADRLVEQVNPPSTGPGLASALVLYRSAVLAAVRARNPGADGTDVEQALAILTPAPERREVLARLLSETEGPRLESDDELRARAVAAREAVRDVVQSLVGARRQAARVLLQRAVRTSVLAVLVLAVVIGAGALVRAKLRHPNVLSAAPFHASSDYAGLSVADGVCDGRRTKIFFHTNMEEQPWIVFDLRAPAAISHVEIRNRTDCCSDRAVPLVVEVSVDGTRYTEVARRAEAFQEFETAFPPVTTKHLRVRALRKTWLHLERIEAW